MSDCNIQGSLPPLNTGSRSACVSDAGAFDMVGNVWEWVADWSNAANCMHWDAAHGTDVTCVAGSLPGNGVPGVLTRGGYYANGSDAGVFATVVVRRRPHCRLPLRPRVVVGKFGDLRVGWAVRRQRGGFILSRDRLRNACDTHCATSDPLRA